LTWLFQSSRKEGYFKVVMEKSSIGGGGHLNCVYGGVAGGAAVMSALVYKLNKVDRRITEANNSDQKAGKKSEWG
jgi:hypothetical protein